MRGKGAGHLYGDEQVEVDRDLEALNRRLVAQTRRRRMAQVARQTLAGLWRRAVTFYWLVCLAVIGMGLNRAYPGPGQHLAWAFQDPALDLDAPFATCAQANANGYFNIPRASKAYLPAQDPDSSGRSCAPASGRMAELGWRLRTVEDRLFAPWWESGAVSGLARSKGGERPLPERRPTRRTP